MAGLQLKDIRKSFGNTEIIKGLSLEVHDGEFLSLVGESGCGKSTLLRIISGLETPDSGDVLIDGRSVIAKPPKQRNIAMVFQDYALYPHMSVGQNIAMPLIMSRLPLWGRLPLLNKLSAKARSSRPIISSDVENVAKQLHIDHLLDRRPAELSGGQRQRVALGRALVRNPQLFLMDEPLSNLDAKLRVEVRKEITELHHSSGLTFVYVTHDQTEAMTMSDRVALLQKGNLLQLAAPSTLYTDPQSIDVARFIGSPEINILPASINNGQIRLGATDLPINVERTEGALCLGLRPEDIRITSKTDTDTLDIKLKFNNELTEDMGHEYLLHGKLDVLDEAKIRIRVPKSASFASSSDIAQNCEIGFDYASLLIFDKDGKRLDKSTVHTSLREAAA